MSDVYSKNSDVFGKTSEISSRMSENFFEFSYCLGALCPISPFLAVFPAPSSANFSFFTAHFALQLCPKMGNYGGIPHFFEPFMGESYLCRKTNLSTYDDRDSPFSAKYRGKSHQSLDRSSLSGHLSAHRS